MKKTVLLSIIVALLFSTLLMTCVYGEVDKTSAVTRVIDGDTFDIATGERIRLADVDAPEYYENGYSEATDYLTRLVDGKIVCLDIDDGYTYDYNGKGDRLVCVVYVDHNSTHWTNVNKALLSEGHAVTSNFHNEFSPYSWSLYVPKSVSSEEIDFSPYPLTPTPKPDFSLPKELLEPLVGLGLIFGILAFLALLEKAVKRKRRRYY